MCDCTMVSDPLVHRTQFLLLPGLFLNLEDPIRSPTCLFLARRLMKCVPCKQHCTISCQGLHGDSFNVCIRLLITTPCFRVPFVVSVVLCCREFFRGTWLQWRQVIMRIYKWDESCGCPCADATCLTRFDERGPRAMHACVSSLLATYLKNICLKVPASILECWQSPFIYCASIIVVSVGLLLKVRDHHASCVVWCYAFVHQLRAAWVSRTESHRGIRSY